MPRKYNNKKKCEEEILQHTVTKQFLFIFSWGITRFSLRNHTKYSIKCLNKFIKNNNKELKMA